MKNKKSNKITLIEILIALLLLSMLMSLIAVNVNRALKRARFDSSCRVLIEKLKLAEELMLTFRDNLKVEIYHENSYYCVLKPGNLSFDQSIKNNVSRPFKLQGIDKIAVIDSESVEYSIDKPLIIDFIIGKKILDKPLLLLGGNDKRFIYFDSSHGKLIMSNKRCDKYVKNNLIEIEFPREIFDKKE